MSLPVLGSWVHCCLVAFALARLVRPQPPQPPRLQAMKVSLAVLQAVPPGAPVATLPAFFAVVEAVIFLLFAIAAMVLFISLPVAIPFAFFSLTEIIAVSVLRAYLFLVIRTYVAATMLAFLVQMLIIFAQRGTALVFVAIAALTMLLSFQFVRMAASTVTEALNVIGSAVGSATGVSVRQTDPFAAAGRVAGMTALAGAAVATGGGALVGAAALLHRQGGLRGGGLGAVGSAALHAARVRSGALVGRTPLVGLQRGYGAVQEHHQLARERAYQLEAVRALALDRDADEAAAILMGQQSASPRRKEWARKKVGEYVTLEEGRQRYRQDMRAAGMQRLGWKGYSRSWKPLPLNERAAPAQPEQSAAGATDAASIAGPGDGSRPIGPTLDTAPASSLASTPGAALPAGAASGGETDASSGAGVDPNAGRGAGNGANAAHTRSRGSRADKAAPVTSRLDHSVPVPEDESYLVTMLKVKANGAALAPDLRATAHNAVLAQNKAVALAGDHLVVYGGVRSEDDPRLGRYDLVPVTADVTADIVDLLQKGKHVQRSRKRPGFLIVWDGAQDSLPDGFSPLTSAPSVPSVAAPLWSGADERARRQVLVDAHDIADQVGQGLPLKESSLAGKLGHLSLGDRQRLASMLQEGTISPDGMVRVLEAAAEVADDLGDPQGVLDEFLAPNGYLDLSSPGVASVMSLAESRGGATYTRLPDAQESSSQGMPASDLALLISAGLGLKRTVPWPQVKRAIVRASVSDAPDAPRPWEPARAVSDELGTASLRTSTAPIRRFVETARLMGMSEADVSATLDVAGAARDMGAVIAAVSEKDQAKRHTAWRAAGVPQKLLQPLDGARRNALRQAPRLAPAGMAGNKARETAEETFGALLAEGMTINSELYSVPIETYSAHPFVAAGGREDGPSRQAVQTAVPSTATGTSPGEPGQRGEAISDPLAEVNIGEASVAPGGSARESNESAVSGAAIGSDDKWPE